MREMLIKTCYWISFILQVQINKQTHSQCTKQPKFKKFDNDYVFFLVWFWFWYSLNSFLNILHSFDSIVCVCFFSFGFRFLFIQNFISLKELIARHILKKKPNKTFQKQNHTHFFVMYKMINLIWFEPFIKFNV